MRHDGVGRLMQAVRIHALFAIERDPNGLSSRNASACANQRSQPTVAALESRLHEQYAKFSPNNQVTKAIAYSLNCWDAIQHGLVIGAPHRASLSMRDLT